MLFHIFLWLICLSPLFFGTNQPWSWSLYTLLIASIGIIFFGKNLIQPNRGNIAIKPLKYPLCLVLIPIVWALLQISPWVPVSWTHPFWALATEQLPLTIKPMISLTPEKTATALMKLSSYLLVFFLSFQFNRQRNKAKTTFNTTAYFGTAYAVYGLLIFFGNETPIFWLERIANSYSVNATFVNRNSYATYAGLSLFALFPLLLERIKGSLIYGVKSYYGLQYFIENLLIRAWFPLFMAIILFTALFLTYSRGGVMSMLLAIAVVFIILVLSGRLKRGKITFVLLLGLLIMSLSFWSSSDMLLKRMEAISLDVDHNSRLAVYSLLNQAINDNKWSGTGYGSFEKSFRLYRDESIKVYYTAAHSTYLENIFELGLFQALALFGAILWIAIRCLQGIWRRQQYWYYPAVGFAATVFVGTHALVDFSLQIPAIAYIYALIMGAALAQSLPRQQRLKN